MNRHLTSLFVAAVLLVAWAGEAAAQQQYIEGARPTGMAGAYTAVGTGPSGIFHNPAGIATARMYAMSGTYAYTPTNNILNASVVDSQTNPKLSAGAAYSYLFAHEKGEDPSGHDIRLALAVPILPNIMSIGLGGRYAILKQGDSELARGFTMDAGLLFQIVEQFQIGVAAQNLIDICEQQVRCRGITPMTLAGGLAYGKSTAFRLSGDVELDLDTEADDINFRYELGGEYMIAGSFPVRLGYQHREIGRTNHLTGGFGWRENRFGLDASTNVNLNDPSEFTISTSFAFFFN